MNKVIVGTAAAAIAAAALGTSAGAQQPEQPPQPPPEAQQQPPQQDGGRRESQIARAGEAAGAALPAASIGVARSDEHGEYLVDDRGRPVYLLEGESSGESDCYDACALEWPPVVAQQEQVEAEDPALDESLLGTFERPDGSLQVTYGGYPLYYYARDPGNGEVTGQDVTDQWGEWYLVTPEGEPLEHGGSHEEGGRG